MKREYKTPTAQRMDYNYKEQVTANSGYHVGGEYTQFEDFDKCQVKSGTCILLYYSDARSCITWEGSGAGWSLRK